MNMSSLPKTNTAPNGVIYAPFQVVQLTEAHVTAIEELDRFSTQLIFALPVRRISPSKDSPLSFQQRQTMLLSYYPDALVVPVPDHKYPADKVKALESAVRALFSEFRGAILHTDEAFAKLYSENGGKWEVEEAPFLAGEKAHRKNMRETSLPVPKSFDIAEVFAMGLRYGAINAMNNQFPISWPTVDICIKRVIFPKTFYLLGKKPGENGWRFSGGFKDRQDPNYETAVLREAGEEVLKAGVDPSAALTPPKYIGSMNVNDWRYANETDGITTLFYQVEFIGTDDQILAGDDLAATQWFASDEINDGMLEGEHVKLWAMLKKYEGIGI
jgi:bifunctional NMN adenylyltransferase/nudix hydrolase